MTPALRARLDELEVLLVVDGDPPAGTTGPRHDALLTALAHAFAQFVRDAERERR